MSNEYTSTYRAIKKDSTNALVQESGAIIFW
jgi:hypothetical protein